MKTTTVTKLVSGALLTALAVGAMVRESIGGKPKPPPPPPVNYALQLFSMPADYAGGEADVQQMNDLGEAVGRYYLPDGTQQPFYFDALSSSTVATNLNDVSLDPAWAVPNGWYIFAALGINNLGDIVGALAATADPNTRRGFILELRPDPLDPTLMPRLHLVPDSVWTKTYARRINDAGEVLGAGDSVTAYIYRAPLHAATGDPSVKVLPFECWAWDATMNNPTPFHGTQIVTYASSLKAYVRYTPGDAAPEVLNLPTSVGDVRGLSDAGSFCGHQFIRQKYSPYFYDGSIHALTGASFGQDIDSDNDVLGEGGTGTNRPVLFHSTYGTLDLSKIVVASSPAEQQVWTNGSANWSSMTERDIPGTDPSVAAFPAVVGSVRTDPLSTNSYYRAYVLLPIPVQQ